MSLQVLRLFLHWLVFVVVVESSLHILDISLLPNMICKIFFHSVGCVFTLGILSFDVQKLFYLMRSSCSDPKSLLEGKTWSHTHDIWSKLSIKTTLIQLNTWLDLKDQPSNKILWPNGKPFLWKTIMYFAFNSSCIQIFDIQSQMERIIKK